LRVFNNPSIDRGNQHTLVIGDHPPIYIEDATALGHEFDGSRLHFRNDAIGLVFRYRLQEPDTSQQQGQQGERN
jgi:hypothetical protein